MAQGKDFYIPFQDGSGRIHGICWEPEETPWAVIQVAHGMIEHIGRYEEFAQAMNRAGDCGHRARSSGTWTDSKTR